MPGDLVLIVDDNAANLKLVRVVLEAAGYDVTTATDASEALAAVRALGPRLVLADIQLPGMDGLEMTRRLKADPVTRDVVVIALTAYAMKGDEEKARAAGCDGYITKPIDTRLLPDLVAAHIGAPAGILAARPPPRDQGPEILVVEDNALTRSMLRVTLESAGYRVREAATGAGALTAIAQRRPDLIVMDLILPDRDGETLLAEVRALTADAPVPVFALSGRIDQLETLRLRGGTFDEFLAKPIEPSRLLLDVEARLDRPAVSQIPALAGRRVLVIDDEPLNVKLARAHLRRAGCIVTATGDPVDGLALAVAEPPDVVLSDILMPRMDGFELCRAIRMEPRLASVPVVLASVSYVEDEDRDFALRVGANALVVRTPDMAQILEALEAAIRQGPAPLSVEGDPELEALHRQRLLRQIERQQQERAQLAQREVRQATTLSLLSGICEALAQPAEAHSVLTVALAHCLDGLGLSSGLILVLGAGGELRAQAIAGLAAEAGARIAGELGASPDVVRVLERGEPASLGPEVLPRAFEQLPLEGGDRRLVLVPLVAQRKVRGLLAVASAPGLLSDPEWVAFSRTISAQLGEALALEEAMAALRASERTYQTLVEGAAEGIYQATADGRLLNANPALARILGYGSAGELRGACDDIAARVFADPSCYRDLLERLEKAETVSGIEAEWTRKDGAVVWVRLSVRAVREEDGSLVRLEGIAEDVTERRAAEQAIRRQEERLASILAASPAAIYALSFIPGQSPAVDWIGSNVEGITGCTAAEALSPAWWPSRVHHDDRARAKEVVESVLESGHEVVEYRFLHRDGGFRWIRDELRLVRSADGQPAQVVGSWSDVTVRRRAEEALRQSEEDYRALFDDSPQPMLVYDPRDLRIVAANDATLGQYGYSREEMLRMTLWDLRLPDDHEALAAFLRDVEAVPGQRNSGIVRHRRKDGSMIDVDLHSAPVLLGGLPMRLVLPRDVTELKRLEEQFRQAQKMEAMGRLAGGVAHDFNNLLTVMNGYADSIAAELPAGSPLLADIREIRKAGGRATLLTRQLLAFSRKQLFDRRPLDLTAVVAGVKGMLSRLVGEDVEVIYDLEDPLPPVLADRSQMEQLLMNLVVNARDAMPRGGSLRIQTRATGAEGCPPDGDPTHVTLSVSDTGHGIDPEVISRVFEPFFTTKGPGKGTGLGLSTVYGIVHQSGGIVRVASEPGAGATFDIVLPRTDQEEALPLPGPAIRSDRMGGGTVLLVEDEPALRSFARSILLATGYSVLDASRGEEALRILEEHPGPIHVLVTDVVMPGMDGGELARLVEARRPGISVVFVSGYAQDAESLGEGLARRPGFLPKPFGAAELEEAVRAVLEE